MQSVVNVLLSSGFVEIKTGSMGPSGVRNYSCTSARIFFNQQKNEIVKLAHDPAYAVFTDWAADNQSARVPRFLEHYETGHRGAIGYWTFTRMERLLELTQSEQRTYSDWHEEVMGNLKQGIPHNPNDDPLGLLTTFLGLQAEAIRASKISENMLSGYDLEKPTNLMARQVGDIRELVYTDPFN